MASDISAIIQNELVNTFDSLLSLKSSVQNVSLLSQDNIDKENHIKIDVEISLNNTSSILVVYLPLLTACKFEYFMLGAIGEVKQSIDDEIIDATKEIIATIGGGLSTTINAQGFDDISDFSFNLNDALNIEYTNIESNDNIYKFDLKLNDDNYNLLMQFDDVLLPFLGAISSGDKIEDDQSNDDSNLDLQVNPNLDSLLSILGENSSDNLKLLFDVRLKFSVRLGSKTFLLKDIVNWDVGQIIELEQMVNEPLDILINNVKVGVGEAVIVDGKFGIKIKYIGEVN